MMIENKSNILKSFQGQKIDQSVHVARWATTINNQDSSKNIFIKYAAGSSNTIQNNTLDNIKTQNIFNTQQSQVHQIQTGFKKLKNNQIQMLKQLKQQYQVLRTLNVQGQNIQPNIINSSSSSSVRRMNDQSQIMSSSSQISKKKKVSINNRQLQILLLQKKQLQMIINNSMKKIQELLHAEMQYKKHIHELKIQANGRQNTDNQYQSMLKTLKKNQINTNDTIDSLKKQNQKLRYQQRQFNQKISSLQGTILYKQQQIRKIFQQKRKNDDLIRVQKDRYFNLQIQFKKIKLQFQLMQKDKNSQINRLSKQIQYKDINKIKDTQNQLKRLQQQIQLKNKRYSLLLNQLEDQKRKTTQFQIQIKQLRNIQSGHILDKQHIQQLLKQFRDKNDGVSFNRNINQVLEKLQDLDKFHNQNLKSEIQNLKDQIIELNKFIVQNPKQNDANYILYEQKINKIQSDLRYKEQQNDNQIKENKKLKVQIQDLKRKLTNVQSQLQQYEAKQTKHKLQQTKLKTQIKIFRMKSQQNEYIQSAISMAKSNHQALSYKKMNDLEQEVKNAHRRASQYELNVSKITGQLTHKFKMQQSQNKLALNRTFQDLQRMKRQYNILKDEYQKYKYNMQAKLNERQKQYDTLRFQIRDGSDSSQQSLNNLKLQYENLSKNDRQKYRQQTQKLIQQITSLTKLNQKYMMQTNKYVTYQDQLRILRQIMRRGIHLGQGVDHLWRVKQTQYQNIDQILRNISSSWQK